MLGVGLLKASHRKLVLASLVVCRPLPDPALFPTGGQLDARGGICQRLRALPQPQVSPCVRSPPEPARSARPRLEKARPIGVDVKVI